MKKSDGYFNRLGVSRKEIHREFGVDLYLFLDAVSLGLTDKEISRLIGYDLDTVKKVRRRLGNVTSSIGITYKKDFTS